MEPRMAEESKPVEVPYEFRYLRDRHLLVPYVPGDAEMPEESLVEVWRRLKEQKLYDIVFHENPSMSLGQFLSFFAMPTTRLCLFAISHENTVRDIAGMAWLADVQSVAGVLTKAVGSFVYFRDHMHPAWTSVFGYMFLEWCFRVLRIDTIVGLTPEPNRAAVLYVKRAGMREVARIPEYTVFQGERCAAVITALTRAQFEENHKGASLGQG